MTIKPNGTDAKDIALHFISVTVGRATPDVVKKTIIQAKTLLSSGYTKQEVINVINYVIANKNIVMYSLGYINACINDVLREIKQAEAKEEARLMSEKVKQEIASEQSKQENEVITDGESAQRNRNKLSRFGVQPRFGKEFDSNLFKGD